MKKHYFVPIVLILCFLLSLAGCTVPAENQTPDDTSLPDQTEPITSYDAYFSKEIVYDYWVNPPFPPAGWTFDDGILSFEGENGEDVIITDEMLTFHRTEQGIYYAIPGELHYIKLNGSDDRLLYKGDIVSVTGNDDAVFFLTEANEFYRYHMESGTTDFFCATEDKVLTFRPYSNFAITWAVMIDEPSEYMGEQYETTTLYYYFDIRDGTVIDAPIEAIEALK